VSPCSGWKNNEILQNAPHDASIELNVFLQKVRVASPSSVTKTVEDSSQMCLQVELPTWNLKQPVHIERIEFTIFWK
jgi:hypothetical protein